MGEGLEVESNYPDHYLKKLPSPPGRGCRCLDGLGWGYLEIGHWDLDLGIYLV